jgi:hypothetical protein
VAAKARCKYSAGIWNFLTARFSRCRSGRPSENLLHPHGVPVDPARAEPVGHWPRQIGDVLSITVEPARFTGRLTIGQVASEALGRPLAYSRKAKTPASGGLGLTGDRSIAFFPGVSLWDNAEQESGFRTAVTIHPRARDRRDESSRCARCSQESAAHRQTTGL